MAYTTKDTKRKSKEAVVAEPAMVYGRAAAPVAAPAALGVLKQYFVPKKDLSFLEDMARVRGWKPVEADSPWATGGHEPNACTVKAMKDALAGRVHHADSVEDMFNQIFEKGRTAVPKTAAAKKKEKPLRAPAKIKACVKLAAPMKAKKRRKTGLDRALEDVKAGRIHRYDSVEDLFSKIEKEPTKPAKKMSELEKAVREVERGEVWEYDSVDDMFNQILGKGWRTK